MDGFMSAASIASSQPVTYLPRQCSSLDYTSSTGSSARSPPAESDYSTNDPCTPPDSMLLSPPAQYHENWTLQNQTLAGLINDYDYPKPKTVCDPHQWQPEFPVRGCSMSSNSSSYNFGFIRGSDLALARETSPSEMSQVVKEEATATDIYPLIEPEGEVEAEAEAEVKDERDADYKFKATIKPTDPNINRPLRRKRNSVSQAMSPMKKSKLGLGSSIVKRTRGSHICSECQDVSFQDENGLQKHMKQQHTRPFICVFRFAGCESTFASKNEWKRHVASQHLLLSYWLCQQDTCAKLSNTSASSTKATGTSRHRSANPTTCHARNALPNGAIFNRKDLYTQHLRRMHVPPAVKKQVKAKKTVPEWEERVRICQEEAHKQRCELPDFMACPAPGCKFTANGTNAWDERMEHAAKHLERAANGQEAPAAFGGESDQTLMAWVQRPDVAVVKHDGRGWALDNPLKPQKVGSASSASDYGEEDASGEEVDY